MSNAILALSCIAAIYSDKNLAMALAVLSLMMTVYAYYARYKQQAALRKAAKSLKKLAEELKVMAKEKRNLTMTKQQLKNRHGKNVSWFCLEGSVSLPELQDDKYTLPSDFEVMGENENGEEGSCDILVVELLESAHVFIEEKEKETELAEAKLLVQQELINELTEALQEIVGNSEQMVAYDEDGGYQVFVVNETDLEVANQILNKHKGGK